MAAPSGAPFGALPEPSSWALEHASELGLFSENPPSGRVELVLVTDPWSVWCWGFEPARRALELRYPTIAFRAHVGGMFAELPDPASVGFDVERFFATVQRTTGMPLRLDATRKDRPTSTFPACIHAIAARLLRPELEGAYLRRLREAIYVEGRNVSRRDVAGEIAESVGIPRVEFEEALNTGEPQREFAENLARLHAESVHAYPTYLVRARDRLVRVEGFQPLPSIVQIVETVSGRLHAARPPPAILDVILPGERVATREVAEVLEVGVEEAAERLAALAAEGKLARTRLPNGDVWRRA